MNVISKKVLSTIVSSIIMIGAVHSAEIDYTNPSKETANYKFLNTNKNVIKDSFSTFVNFINKDIQNGTSDPTVEMAGYKGYENAVKKYMQGNTSVSYRELNTILYEVPKQDFLYVSLAYKYTNLGFFSLAKMAVEKVEDKNTWAVQTDLIINKYFPKETLNSADELYLAGLYSDIYFHNLAFEVVKDLSKKDKLLKKSDYANYILSLAYCESKEYKKALSSINKAIDLNGENVNYQKAKAQILCELKDYKPANLIMAKLVRDIDNFILLKQEILALQEYILAKSSKQEYLSKYHLGRYFYLKNENARAIKTLNQSLGLKKKYYPAMTLLGKIYTDENNLTKAQEYYSKAYKLNKNDAETLLGLGDLQFKTGNVQNALNYFFIATKKNKTYLPAILYGAMCYKILNQPEIALKMCNDAMILNPKNPETYYVLSKIDLKNRTEYLKKVTAFNPLYTEAWLDLAYNSIMTQKFKDAKNYLLPVKYIDSNNYKAYYYQGLIEKHEQNTETAMIYFEKAIKINPNYEPALNEVKREI